MHMLEVLEFFTHSMRYRYIITTVSNVATTISNLPTTASNVATTASNVVTTSPQRRHSATTTQLNLTAT